MSKRKIDEQISYNKLFVVVASLFALSAVWAVYDEVVVRREWKQVQEEFFAIETDLSRIEKEQQEALLSVSQCASTCSTLKLNDCKTICNKASELAALRQTQKQLQTTIESNADQIAELEEVLAVVKEDEQNKTQALTFSNAEWSGQNYLLRLAKHAYLENPEDLSLKETFDREKSQWNDQKAQVEREDIAVKDIVQKRKKIENHIEQLRLTKQIQPIVKRIEILTQTLQTATHNYTKTARKQTGLFGAKTSITQYNLPKLDKADRCTTCHLGVTRGGFEAVAKKEFQSHPLRRVLLGTHEPEKFGCTSCHDGQGRATTKFFAHAPGPDEDSHAFHKHYWEFPLLSGPLGGDGTEYMESKCRTCHGDNIMFQSTVACETDLECQPLQASNKKVHCANPRLVGLEKAQYSFDTLPGTSSDKIDAINAAKSNNKLCVDRRKRPLTTSLAPHYTQGAKIVEELGCFGCHPIKGFENIPKVGSDLRRVGHKLSPEWMMSWIQNPKKHNPETRMPKFWPEIDDPDVYAHKPDVAAITTMRHTESLAMTSFLLHMSGPEKTCMNGSCHDGASKQGKINPIRYDYTIEAMPSSRKGNISKGKEALATLGCAGCHDLPDNAAMTPKRVNRGSHFSYGSRLDELGSKTNKAWLYSWLRNPRQYAPHTNMPNMRLSQQEALDIVAYLSSLKTNVVLPTISESDLNNIEHYIEGNTLVKKYGCYGCHEIESYQNEPGIGADLSSFGVKLADRLDFGDYITDHSLQTWNRFTANKLRHPRVYSYKGQSPVETVMPEFGLNQEEIVSVMTFLKSLRGDADEKQRKALAVTENPLLNEGRRLLRTYNCYGCHTVDGFQGELATLPSMSGSNSIYGPPPLTLQGLKTKPTWLFDFLKEPSRLRPLPQVRMPTFDFTDQEATALVAMFSAIDGVTYPFVHMKKEVDEEDDKLHADMAVGLELFRASGCQQCHAVGVLDSSSYNASVKAPSFTIIQRFRQKWLELWLADPGAMQKNTAMPAFWLAGNMMQQFWKTNATFRERLKHIDSKLIEHYIENPQMQIQAISNFLFRQGLTDIGR